MFFFFFFKFFFLLFSHSPGLFFINFFFDLCLFDSFHFQYFLFVYFLFSERSIFSRFGNSIPSVICRFPLFIISIAHFSMTNCISTALVDKVLGNGSGDWSSIPGRVIPKTQKWYLIPPCLTFSIIKYGSRVKWNNRGKGVVPYPTPRCSSYRKGSLRVTLDFICQLYFSISSLPVFGFPILFHFFFFAKKLMSSIYLSWLDFFLAIYEVCIGPCIS